MSHFCLHNARCYLDHITYCPTIIHELLENQDYVWIIFVSQARSPVLNTAAAQLVPVAQLSAWMEVRPPFTHEAENESPQESGEGEGEPLGVYVVWSKDRQLEDVM